MPLKLKLLVFLLIISKISFAQTGNNKIEFTAIEGVKVFAPNDYSIQGQAWGAELGYHFDMTNNHLDYLRLLGIKAIDIVGSYRNMQALTINHSPSSKDSLGNVYSVIGRLEIQFAKIGQSKILFTPGIGVAYSTVSFFTNKNPLVGSHLNLALQAGVKIVTPISSSTSIQAGADLFHYSDAATRTPNDGVNALNFTLGIVQSLDRASPSTPANPFEYTAKYAYEVAFDFGERGAYDSRNNLYRSGLYLGFSDGLNKVFRLKAGLDFDYYFTTYIDAADRSPTYEALGNSFARIRAGISVGADMNMGRLTVMASYGYYYYFQTDNGVYFYWIPGLKYYILPWMALQGKVYIHGHQADYLGVGLAFRIRK